MDFSQNLKIVTADNLENNENQKINKLKIMKIILVSLILVTGFIGCTKENKDSALDKIYFSGITKTDLMGNLLSNPDTTDWRFDDKWVTKEEDLFSVKYKSSNQKSTASIYLYPNPFQDIFRISFYNNPKLSRLSIRLINKDFKVILKNDSIHGSVSIVPSYINGYDTLRLYYKLIDTLNFEFKGHGDILIKK